ncbi:DUF262 domain-containing protein [Desulfobacterales bacterium HSG2]|nr:DUF262 domain-containing protein [Desulfobacterales bacterium HSG2]
MKNNIEFQEGTDTLGNHPLDSLIIRPENRSVFEVIRGINQPEPGQPKFILDTDIQRDFAWNCQRQSKLIESCLMRIPLPVFYFAEQENGNIVVVDGQQRLTALKNYLADKFALRGLANGSPLLGKKFGDLPPKLQNRLEDTRLILYLIDHKVPEQAKLDIFERVNSGRPLTRQQMRNALHNGPATRWLREQSEKTYFLKCIRFGKRVFLQKNMLDREAVNRFCAFTLMGTDKYGGNMDQFLAETLIRMNEMTENELDNLAKKLDNSMRNNCEVFGEKAFQIYEEKRYKISLAYFDVLSVILSDYPFSKIKEKKNKIADAFENLRKKQGIYRKHDPFHG